MGAEGLLWSQAPVFVCLPGPSSPLHMCSRVCKLQQHQSPSSSAPVVLACRLPWAVPACVMVLGLGGRMTLHRSPAPTAGARTHFCKVLL